MANNQPVCNRKVTITHKIDPEIKAFEKALLERGRLRPYEEDTLHPIDIPLFQRTDWLEHSGHDFRIIQVYGEDGLPASQVVALIIRPKGIRWFTQAKIPYFGCSSVSHEDELWLLNNLAKLLQESDGIIKIHLHAYRSEFHDLADFNNLAKRARFKLTDSLGITRTTFLNIKPTADEILASLNAKVRRKFRINQEENFEIRALNTQEWVPQLARALNSSFLRTGGGMTVFDFQTAINFAQKHPDKICILGFFFKSRPDELLAFLLTVRHGSIAEALSSGSLPDAELRKTSFNYLMHWQTVLWAKSHGAEALDLGGITDGGTTDPLAGISAFKRRFTRWELEVGREFEKVTCPLRYKIFCILNKLRACA